MPFIAVCPHCHKSKFRVPSKKRGQPETCPKCQQHFLLLPEGESAAMRADFYRLPDPLESDSQSDSDENPTAISDSVEAAMKATAVPEVTAAASSIVERAPEPIVPPTFAPPVVIVRHPDPPVTHDGYTVPQLFAFGGGMLFGFGMITTLLPYGRILAILFMLVGAMLALLSLLGLFKQLWLGLVSVGVNVFGLLVVTLMPSWVGLDDSGAPVLDDSAPQVTAVSRDGSQTAVPVEWVDAAKAVWQQGDVRMQVQSASVGWLDPKLKSKEKCLRITLSITNVGVARAVEFQGWATNPMALPQLSVSGKPVAMRVAETVATAPVYPGKSAEATLVFAVPPSGDELKLELPAIAFAGTDPVRFRIPTTMLK